MQDIVLKVFVVALGLLTYPTPDDPGVEEQGGGEDALQCEFRPLEDEECKRDQEKAPVNVEMAAQRETEPDQVTGLQGRPERTEQPLSQVHTKTSHNKTAKEALAEWGKDFLWYTLNTFSIISMISFLRKYLSHGSQMRRDCAGEVTLPDGATLQTFHTKCVVASEVKWRDAGFLEGFANDLVEAMRLVCMESGGMVIEDVTAVDASDLHVPVVLPEPYRCRCLLGDDGDPLPDAHVRGRIQVSESSEAAATGCPCGSRDADDDVVCLLHSDKARTRDTRARDELCSKDGAFLSKSRVTRWFRSTIRRAWERISHKYEFELSIRNVDSPGTLAVRFRSGKVLRFRLNPVVKFDNNAYFCIAPGSAGDSDTSWTLSLTSYEDSLLQRLSERLPDQACHMQTLEIACFLHRRQTTLFGSSAVKDFHFKTALMHLLLNKPPSQWKADAVAHRLRDLMAFMERSLQKKLLHHILLGNPVTQRLVPLPAELTRARPVNLFHPLVVHDCVYRNAAKHFQEMLRNAHVLIQDYTDPCTGGSA